MSDESSVDKNLQLRYAYPRDWRPVFESLVDAVLIFNMQPQMIFYKERSYPYCKTT
jgi:hypothetical protein